MPFPSVVADTVIGCKVCSTCTGIYFAGVPEYTLYVNSKFFFWQVSQLLENFCCCQMITDFCWYFMSTRMTFSMLFENGQVNVWSKHKARWLANICFSCSRMLIFVMTYWKNFQLLGVLPPRPYQGLCPWTPLEAYCGPQTPTSFSCFFTLPQSHVWGVSEFTGQGYHIWVYSTVIWLNSSGFYFSISDVQLFFVPTEEGVGRYMVLSYSAPGYG